MIPRLARCILAGLVLAAVAGVPASAQSARDVEIDFEVGDFDSARQDWPIVAVEVSGDLDRGEPFTVELRDGDGDVLWSGAAAYQPPTTSIDVGTFVAVGDVEEAAIAQRRPGGAPPTTTEPPPTTQPAPTTTPTDPTDPPDPTEPPVPGDPGGPVPVDEPVVEGDVVTRPVRTPLVDPDDPAVEADEAGDEDDPIPEEAAGGTPPGAPPSVGDDVVTGPEDLPQQGNGATGAGQLALSMVIAVVFVAILFRTPLPSATTVRWRK